MTHRSLLLLLPVLAACGDTGFGDNPSYYPEGGTPPTLSGLSPDDETGNLGGQTVTIEGSGFGDDPDRVTVVFQGRNARIVSVSDSALSVVVPHGPIEGGAVDITVGTPEGQATLADGYTYQVDGVTEGETAYVMVQEMSFAGDYLFDGSAEFYEIAYPRVHSTMVGYWGAADTAGQWRFEAPDTASYAEWVDDLRVDLGESFTLRLPELEGKTACYRPTYEFRYGGGPVGEERYDPLSVSAQLSDGEGCEGPGEIEYDRSTIRFCKAPSSTVPDPSYRADWPLLAEDYGTTDSRDAILGLDEEGQLDADAAAEVVLDLDPTDDDPGVTLILPERFALRGTKGFVVSDDEDRQDQWGGYGVNACFDDNGDGSTSLDETALEWTWAPSALDAEALLAAAREANGEGVIEDVRVYVNASVIYGAFSWLGLEGFSARSTIEVDDGAGALTMPAEVLYQFPSIVSSWGGTRPGNSLASDYAYLLFSVARIVEYRVRTDEGTVVFAFVNAELGASGWNHPLDQDGCGDCQDNDGDGWTDAEDPDCSGDGTEELGYGESTCNDGLDNDDDGDVDREDSVCEDADDGEDNCSDGRDNDRDGLTDEEDCECIAGGSESGGTVDLSCCDETDDDGDGWIDSADPDCEDGEEEIGYGEDVCNNGLDDDGNGDIDAQDPYCLEVGADGTKEAPNPRGDCDDGEDNDGDGYTDQNDPGCEYPPYDTEDSEPEDSEDLVITCYDGVDNDEDGDVDSADSDCALEGTPNGFQSEGG